MIVPLSLIGGVHVKVKVPENEVVDEDHVPENTPDALAEV